MAFLAGCSISRLGSGVRTQNCREFPVDLQVEIGRESFQDLSCLGKQVCIRQQSRNLLTFLAQSFQFRR